MKRTYFLGSLLLVPVLALALLAVPGCTKGKDDSRGGDAANSGGEKDKTPKEKEGGKSEALEAKATDAVIKGKVVLAGDPPKMPPIKGIEEHKDKPICHEGSEHETHEQTWIIGGGNGVANVVVWLEAPKGKHFKVTSAIANERIENKPILDQPHCVFVPHVVGLFAAYRDGDAVKATDQRLIVKNTSKASHNTKIIGDERAGNSTVDKTMNPGEKPVEVAIKFQNCPLPVKCDKHTWMNATIVTFDQPYFAVTDKDGAFEIKNVPVGADLTVKYWHESFGDNPRKSAKSKAQSFETGNNNLELKISAN